MESTKIKRAASFSPIHSAMETSDPIGRGIPEMTKFGRKSFHSNHFDSGDSEFFKRPQVSLDIELVICSFVEPCAFALHINANNSPHVDYNLDKCKILQQLLV